MLLVSLTACVQRALQAALTKGEPPERDRSRTRALPNGTALLRMGFIFTLIGFALTLVSIGLHA